MAEAFPRPSGAERWIAGGCRGSARLEAKHPETRSLAAQEGTRLHGLAAQMLRGQAPALAEDDAKVVLPYVENVRATVALASPQAQLFVEVQTWAHYLRDLRGTPDAALIDFVNRRVTIWDLKTGWSIVEVIRNWQLLCYAWMHCRSGWTHDLRIVQPLPYHEAGPVRSWIVSFEEIEKYAEEIRTAFLEATAEDALLRAGPHCRFCSALVECPTARAVTLGALEMVTSQTRELPDEHLGRELELLRETARLLQLRAEAIESEIEVKLRAGASVPGVYLRENKRGGRLQWALDEEQARATLIMLTGEDPARAKLPTPTQLRDAGVDEQILRPLTVYKPGRMVVATDADDQAKKIFGDAPSMEHVR